MKISATVASGLDAVRAVDEIWDVIALIDGADGLIENRDNSATQHSLTRLLETAREHLVNLGLYIDGADVVPKGEGEA